MTPASKLERCPTLTWAPKALETTQDALCVCLGGLRTVAQSAFAPAVHSAFAPAAQSACAPATQFARLGGGRFCAPRVTAHCPKGLFIRSIQAKLITESLCERTSAADASLVALAASTKAGVHAASRPFRQQINIAPQN